MAGLLALILILQFSAPVPISSFSELQNLSENQKVLVSGFVEQQTSYSIKLNNNLSLICNGCPSYKSKNISAIGAIDNYNNKKEIKVLKITITNDN